MKQLEVRIMGQNYLLGCAQGAEQELLSAVRIVDQEMCNIRDGGKLRARERIAVLAALNLAVNMNKKNQQLPLVPSLDTQSVDISNFQSNATYENLISRIDKVLGADGHLL